MNTADMTLLHPDWRYIWSVEQLERELAPFKFQGEGWYESGTDTLLIISHLSDEIPTYRVMCWNVGGAAVRATFAALLSMPVHATTGAGAGHNRLTRATDECINSMVEPEWHKQHQAAGGGDLVPATKRRQAVGDQLVKDAVARVLPPLAEIKAHNIPPDHVEWCVRVYRMTNTTSRAPNETLARTFDKEEARARSFFTQTQNIWNVRVRAGEATAFDVVLGVQDARKHKKKGSFTELQHVMCTGTQEA